MKINRIFSLCIHFPSYCLIFFSFFTIYYHIFLFCRATFIQFCYLGFPLSIFSTLIYFCYYKFNNIFIQIKQHTDTTNNFIQDENKYISIMISIACIIMFIYFFSKSYHLTWILCVIFLLVSLFYKKQQEKNIPVSTLKIKIVWKDLFAIFLLSFLYALLTICIKRTDADDALFVAIAVHLINLPHEQLFQTDPLFHDIPFKIWPYQFESFNVLSAVLSTLTNLQPAKVSHYILATISSILYPLAWSRFFLHFGITPRVIFFPFLLLSFLLAESHASFGNFTFVRFFQGKAIFVSIIVPLIYSSIWDFINDKKKKDILNVFLLSVAAFGCTSSAIFIVPQIIGFSLICAYSFISIRNMCYLISPIMCYYGFWIITFFITIISPIKNSYVIPVVTEDTVQFVFGTIQKFILLFFILTSWLYIKNQKKKYYFLLLTLLYFLIPLNPYCMQILKIGVTPYICWRELWTIPIWGIACIGLYGLTLLSATYIVSIFKQGNKNFIQCILLCFFTISMLSLSNLRSSNFERMGFDRLWYPKKKKKVLSTIDKNLTSGQTIIAPYDLSCWLTTFKKRYHVLTNRYLVALDEYIKLYDPNIAAFLNLENPTKEEQIFFINWVKDVSPNAIVIKNSQRLYNNLTLLGYERILIDPTGDLFLKIK